MGFWSQFQRPVCFPDNCNCEFIRDAWIGQPSCFWSSLFYIISALILYRQVSEKTFSLKLWTAAVVVLGISSHLAHGAFIEFTMAMDFAGIVTLMSFFPLLRLFKMLKVSQVRITIFFMLNYVILWFCFHNMHKLAKIGICVIIFVFAFYDLMRETNFWKERDLKMTLVLMLTGFACFMLDENRVWCDPWSWNQGHSFWHLATAVAIYYYGRWRFISTRSLVTTAP